ncbi:YicC family protein, partial [bacterium]
LEASLRLPDELRQLDPELRAAVQSELKRGKVDCTVTLRTNAAAGRQLELDTVVVAQLRDRLAELAHAFGRHADASAGNLVELMRFPGVLREASVDPEPLLAATRTLFAEALTELVAMRGREGARLKDLIVTRCDQLASHVARVRTRLPEVHVAIRAKFAERLAELSGAIESERVEQEIVMILQRLDVAEELDRLDGHLEEIRKIVGSPEPAGRRLDFLMQELNREANTLSSKSQDLATTRTAVDMKVVIEQMREQVQNIE